MFLGLLTRLEHLDVRWDLVREPPPQVVSHGLAYVMDYLRYREREGGREVGGNGQKRGKGERRKKIVRDEARRSMMQGK